MTSRTIGGYQVEGEISRDDRVYTYSVSRDGEIYTLKEIRLNSSDDPGKGDRFLEVIQELKKLKHPSLLDICDFGADEEKCYWLWPGNHWVYLNEFIDERGPLTAKRALELLNKLVEGLERVPDPQFFHLALSSEKSIILEEETSLKAPDLGLAQFFHHTQARDPAFEDPNPPFYISPEACFADDLNHERSLIFNLGMILYHMVAGRPPFVHENPMKILTAICYDLLPSPLDFNPKLDPRIFPLIYKMTAREIEDRLPDLRAVKEAIATNL